MNSASTARPNRASRLRRSRRQASCHRDVPCSASLMVVMVVAAMAQLSPNCSRRRGFIQAARMSDSRLNKTISVDRNTVVPSIIV